MFEAVQEKKDSGSSKLWIGLFVVVAVVALGILFYTMSRGSAKSPAATTAAASPQTKASADAVKDLKIQRVNMQKDSSGTTAVWLVTLENRSDTYTYSEINYESDYMGADSKPILVNHGEMNMSLGPGAEKSTEIRDAAYPAATAWYKFKITGAKAAAE